MTLLKIFRNFVLLCMVIVFPIQGFAVQKKVETLDLWFWSYLETDKPYTGSRVSAGYQEGGGSWDMYNITHRRFNRDSNIKIIKVRNDDSAMSFKIEYSNRTCSCQGISSSYIYNLIKAGTKSLVAYYRPATADCHFIFMERPN